MLGEFGGWTGEEDVAYAAGDDWDGEPTEKELEEWDPGLREIYEMYEDTGEWKMGRSKFGGR